MTAQYYKFLTVVILFTFYSVNAQTKTDSKKFFNKSEGLTCENGKVDAVTDFNKGIYYYFVRGYITPQDEKLTLFTDDYLDTKYGIKTIYTGCIVREFTTCYAEKMKILLQEKFGADIIEKATKEAEKAYRIK
ncbi:FEKKY domain-containing protein [Flavobacterium oreochromis]|uniref:FEKKY domain-containing protein n=1 Tax=Flavobacterium oreochromis TaxID=2906078 RepID=UPI00385B7413